MTIPDESRVAPLAAIGLDEIGPERISFHYDPRSGMRAAIVIDSARFGLTAGGVRMASDLTLLELARLARAMTYKFAMLELPCGGAKAGIWLDPGDARRQQVMRAFLDVLRPLAETRAYMAGADMGTAAADFTPLRADGGATPSLGEIEYEGMPLEEQLTGYGVVVAARVAAEACGWSLRGAHVALEGFGKVGAGAAKFLAREGARLVAVSTLRGTLHRADGLDVERLLALRHRHGDAAVEHYDAGGVLPREALFGVAADILIPGARPDVIDAAVAGQLAVRLVVPAANIPYAAAVPAQLHARGIVSLPDFVSNAGGVLTGLVELEGGTAAQAFTTVHDRIAANVGLILDSARAEACSAYDAALAIAHGRLGCGGGEKA
jgi:glutamate dehydrogenase (NAD(P)+)